MQQATTEGFVFPEGKQDDGVYIRCPYTPETKEKKWQEEEAAHQAKKELQQREFTPEYLVPRSTAKAYMWFFLGGLVGLHRFYLGHREGGIGILRIFMISSYTLMGSAALWDSVPSIAYFLGVLFMASSAYLLVGCMVADFILLPFSVRFHNRRVRFLLKKRKGRKQKFRFKKIPYRGDFVVSKRMKRRLRITDEEIYSTDFWKYT